MIKEENVFYIVIVIVMIIVANLLPYMKSHDFWTALISQFGAVALILGTGYYFNK